MKNTGLLHFILKKATPLVTGLIALAISISSPAEPINFSEYPAGEPRKEAFFNYLLPLAIEENQSVLETREKLEIYSKRRLLTDRQKQWTIETAAKYRMSNFDIKNPGHWQTLLAKIDVIPPSLVMAQSANESGWGTSRFAREVNNYFGQWCFQPGCGVVPRRRPRNATYEVLTFENPKQSVRSYIHYLNTSNAYKKLRTIRQSLRENQKPVTGTPLANGLERYSARGLAYVEEIKTMIRQNKLEEFDTSI